MKLTSELQCSQLAELIYLECLKRGIKLAEDESDRENIEKILKIIIIKE